MRVFPIRESLKEDSYSTKAGGSSEAVFIGLMGFMSKKHLVGLRLSGC